MNTENKTIAQWLGITSFPFTINVNDKEIYYENSNGGWVKREFDKNGREIYRENSYGDWVKREFDKNGKEIYRENSKDGILIDKRPKEFTMDEIAKALGISVEQLKIKK